MSKIIDYQTLQLQSLDISICSGEGDLSKRIQYLQKLKGIQKPAAEISHSAAIVKIPKEKALLLNVPLDSDNLYVTETTTLNKWCGKKGLQINSFQEWLRNYNGRVWVRKLDFTRTADFDTELVKFIFQHLQDPKSQKYESGIPGLLELILCEFGIKKSILQTAELHCTEWVAELLKRFKLLFDYVSSNRMPPCEWWDDINVITGFTILCSKIYDIRQSSLDLFIRAPISKPIRIK